MKVGISQYKIQRGQPEQNLAKIGELTQAASSERADLLCLPEMVTTGFDWKRNAELLPEADGHRDVIAGLARENAIQICGSILERTEAGNAANTLYYFDRDGSILAKYRKIHLFTLFHEDDHVEPGDATTVFDSEWGKIGLGICYDIRFPELFRKNAELGATIQILPAAFPYPRLEHWQTLIKARAIENQCFFIGLNQTGKEGHGDDVGTTHYFGHSMIVDPWGETVVEGGEESALLFAELDPELPARVRRKFPALQDRRSQLFR